MPVSCPNGNLYTIQEGDSLWTITRKHGVSLNQLLQANPQIQNPNNLVPGQIICIPGTMSGVQLPCCLILKPTGVGSRNGSGVALIHRIISPLGNETTSIDILAHGLSHPSSLGNYDSYEGFAQVPNVISWRFRLYATPESDPTLAGRFDYVTARLTPETRVQVRLGNSASGQLGPAVLQNTLQQCGTS